MERSLQLTAFKILRGISLHSKFNCKTSQSFLFLEDNTTLNNFEKSPLAISYWVSCRKTMMEPNQFAFKLPLDEGVADSE